MEDRVPVDEYAQRYGFRTSEVLYKIRAGILDGEEVDGHWFVLRYRKEPRRPESDVFDTPIREKVERLRTHLRRWVAPRYDELTLLTMSTAFLWLLVLDAPLRTGILDVVYGSGDVRLFLLFAVFLGGMLFSIVHAFTTRDKTEGEREGMLFFAVVSQSATAVVAGIYLLKNESLSAHWAFPVWNLISGLSLSMLYRFRIVDETCILDDDPAVWQSLSAFGMTLGLTILGHHLLEFHWTTTLSMTVALATTVSRLIDEATRILLRFRD